VHEVNYTSTSIRHMYTIHTILGIPPYTIQVYTHTDTYICLHTNTNTTRQIYKFSKNIIQLVEAENTERDEDTCLNL